MTAAVLRRPAVMAVVSRMTLFAPLTRYVVLASAPMAIVQLLDQPEKVVEAKEPRTTA